MIACFVQRHRPSRQRRPRKTACDPKLRRRRSWAQRRGPRRFRAVPPRWARRCQSPARSRAPAGFPQSFRCRVRPGDPVHHPAVHRPRSSARASESAPAPATGHWRTCHELDPHAMAASAWFAPPHGSSGKNPGPCCSPSSPRGRCLLPDDRPHSCLPASVQSLPSKRSLHAVPGSVSPGS